MMKILDNLDKGLPPVVYGDGSQAYDRVLSILEFLCVVFVDLQAVQTQSGLCHRTSTYYNLHDD
jgi:hypothetical protein